MSASAVYSGKTFTIAPRRVCCAESMAEEIGADITRTCPRAAKRIWVSDEEQYALTGDIGYLVGLCDFHFRLATRRAR